MLLNKNMRKLKLATLAILYQASNCHADASQPISPPSLGSQTSMKSKIRKEKGQRVMGSIQTSDRILDTDEFDIDDDFAIYDKDDQKDLNVEFSNELLYDDEGIGSLFGSKSDSMGEDSEYDGDQQQQYGQGTEKGALYDAYNLLHTLAQVWFRFFLLFKISISQYFTKKNLTNTCSHY